MTIHEKIEIAKKKWKLSNLYHEYNVLQQFPEKYCCKVYEYDKKAPMFLEERIQPGTKQHIYSVAMKKVC